MTYKTGNNQLWFVHCKAATYVGFFLNDFFCCRSIDSSTPNGAFTPLPIYQPRAQSTTFGSNKRLLAIAYADATFSTFYCPLPNCSSFPLFCIADGAEQVVVTDGTPAGTYVLTNLTETSNFNLVDMGDYAMFSVSNSQQNIWYSIGQNENSASTWNL